MLSVPNFSKFSMVGTCRSAQNLPKYVFSKRKTLGS